MAVTGVLLQFLLWNFVIMTTYGIAEDEESLPRIGIIGAGIGGTSSAYFLRQLFGDKVHIDVFEAEQVGGRASLVDIAEHKYEAGASIIHVKNRYMLHFNELYRKKESSYIKQDGGKIGLYGSEGMLFETSDWKAITLAKLLWRYGLDLYTLQTWLGSTVFPKFERIYALQDKGMSFTTCEDLLRAMSDDLFNMTQFSLEQVLLDAGLHSSFIKEMGMAAMKNNYGQTTDVHGLVGAVSLLGVEPGGLWSVIGGNMKIPEFLMTESKANLIKGRVTSVALIKGDHSTYELDYIRLDGQELGQTGSREYDLVILATPVHGTKNKIAFVDFPSAVTGFSQDFHETVAMFVQGNINKTTFHLKDENEFPPDVFCVSEDLFFNSIGKPIPVEDSSDSEKSSSKRNVWKTFFNHMPTTEEINKLFESKTAEKLVSWLAYPEYSPKMDLPPFVLNEHLYYVNAIESAASALEMSAIGAKNVALLAYNHWYGHLDRIDESNLSQGSDAGDSRSEL